MIKLFFTICIASGSLFANFNPSFFNEAKIDFCLNDKVSARVKLFQIIDEMTSLEKEEHCEVFFWRACSLPSNFEEDKAKDFAFVAKHAKEGSFLKTVATFKVYLIRHLSDLPLNTKTIPYDALRQAQAILIDLFEKKNPKFREFVNWIESQCDPLMRENLNIFLHTKIALNKNGREALSEKIEKKTRDQIQLYIRKLKLYISDDPASICALDYAADRSNPNGN